MTNLINEIQSIGLCSVCGSEHITAISYRESKLIINRVLDEAIEVVRHRYHDSPILTNESCSQAIQAINKIREEL